MTTTHGHILIVDDNVVNRMVLARALAEQGHTTGTAQDGQQALAALRSTTFDAVLLDVVMPEMDGYATLSEIKSDERLRHIPVIMVSAVDEMDSVVRCIELGATDYLPKPFNAALLQARLNSSLAGKRLRDLELEYLEQVGYVAEAAAAVEGSQFEPATLDRVAAREDALGRLARVFQRMAQEVVAREQRLKRQIEQLRLDMEEREKAASETAAIYIPMDRRQALARGGTLPDRATGAALLADISGFTPLTEALARELGLQRGAEELTRQLNRVYTALIAEVHRFAGSVVTFSGDAITCWFDADDGRRGTACALAMQAAMAQFATLTTPGGTAINLAIKVAVTAGPVRRFLVGDPRLRYMDVLAGKMMDELSAAEHQAGRGEVLVSSVIAAALQPDLTVVERRGAEGLAVVSALRGETAAPVWGSLAPDAVSNAQAEPFLLPPIFEKVQAGKSDLLSELRPAAMLFLQFDGLDYDGDAEAGAKLDAFMHWVERVADRYDGALLQLTVGDKGSYLYIAFGVPVAHVDDAARSVSAALELSLLPTALPFITEVRMGIAYGTVRAGAYGSSAQRAYGALGDKTNLAARLMTSAAPNDILCDEDIRQAAGAQIHFEALPPLTVKGKEQPVAVYRPAGQRADATVSGAGRSAERALLIDHLSPPEQLTLKAASVIGLRFSLAMLRETYPDAADRPNLDENLQTLEDLDLLSPAEDSGMYRFNDPLTRETAYNLMLFAQRRQMHRAVAEWHEHTYAANLAPHFALLAYHWGRAEDTAKTLFYLEKAGEQARHGGDLDTALKYFNESLALEAQAAVLSGDYPAGPDNGHPVSGK